MHLPLDYPRINQFPEWFTVETGSRYGVTIGNERSRTLIGKDLIGGMPMEVGAATVVCIEVAPVLPAR